MAACFIRLSCCCSKTAALSALVIQVEARICLQIHFSREKSVVYVLPSVDFPPRIGCSLMFRTVNKRRCFDYQINGWIINCVRVVLLHWVFGRALRAESSKRGTLRDVSLPLSLFIINTCCRPFQNSVPTGLFHKFFRPLAPSLHRLWFWLNFSKLSPDFEKCLHSDNSCKYCIVLITCNRFVWRSSAMCICLPFCMFGITNFPDFRIGLS